jgi:hypothetical protein
MYSLFSSFASTSKRLRAPAILHSPAVDPSSSSFHACSKAICLHIHGFVCSCGLPSDMHLEQGHSDEAAHSEGWNTTVKLHPYQNITVALALHSPKERRTTAASTASSELCCQSSHVSDNISQGFFRYVQNKSDNILSRFLIP